MNTNDVVISSNDDGRGKNDASRDKDRKKARMEKKGLNAEAGEWLCFVWLSTLACLLIVFLRIVALSSNLRIRSGVAPMCGLGFFFVSS